MIDRIQKIAESPAFQKTVIVLIVANAVLLGLETSEGLMQEYGSLLRRIAALFQILFVIELTLRLAAFWPRPQHFFRDGWNTFDFLIVSVSLMPGTGPFATVARLARVFRLVRLFTVSRDLRLLVTTMLRSIPSITHVVLFMALLMYIYAIVGYHLFAQEDPANWGSLDKALISTFVMLTLEGWVEFQAEVIDDMPLAWMFFSSYIVINVFVVVNLFVAVVLNSLENARADEVRTEAARMSNAELLAQLAAMRATIDALEARLRDEA